MRVLRRAWLLCCLALAACATSEGGVTGTGISSISGNMHVIRSLAHAARKRGHCVRCEAFDRLGRDARRRRSGIELQRAAARGAGTWRA